MLQKLEDMNLMKIINHQQRNKMVKYIVIFASLFFFIAIRFLFLDEKDCIDLYFFLPPIFLWICFIVCFAFGPESSVSATIDALRGNYGKDPESGNFDNELKRLQENKVKKRNSSK